jgi:hypothetical protein
LSPATLAALIDGLVEAKRAFVVETADVTIVTKLNSPDARAICERCVAIGWAVKAVDSQNADCDTGSLLEEFAPYRLTIDKPEVRAGIHSILTRAGFEVHLGEEHRYDCYRIGALSKRFETQCCQYLPWDEEADFAPAPATKSPRSLVREYRDRRRVPADIRNWLLRKEQEVPKFTDLLFAAWVEASIRNLLLSLPDEIDAETEELKFKGPPRLGLSLPTVTTDAFPDLGQIAFLELQEAMAWVFESEREAEMRHTLLATELAQSGCSDGESIACIRCHIGPALQGAKIAYQMSLSDLSRDTLKILGELRKAVTEETAKVTDSNRQTITAIASALTVGIGLIAAKIATNVNPVVLGAIMAVVTGYVVMVVLSGVQFILLQKRLRADWRPRLYRFLEADDYTRMVSKPIGAAETAFWSTAAIGTVATIGLLLTVLWVKPAERDEPARTAPSASRSTTDHTAVTVSPAGH